MLAHWATRTFTMLELAGLNNFVRCVSVIAIAFATLLIVSFSPFVFDRRWR
jgi:hypothetical protein